MEGYAIVVKSVVERTHLLGGKPQLVLENGLAVNQILHLICESAERLDQSLGVALTAHPIDKCRQCL